MLQGAAAAEELDLEAVARAVRRYRARARKVHPEDAAALVELMVQRGGALGASELVCAKEAVGLHPTPAAYAQLMRALGEAGEAAAVLGVYQAAVLSAGPTGALEPELQRLLVQGALGGAQSSKVAMYSAAALMQGLPLDQGLAEELAAVAERCIEDGESEPGIATMLARRAIELLRELRIAAAPGLDVQHLRRLEARAWLMCHEQEEEGALRRQHAERAARALSAAPEEDAEAEGSLASRIAQALEEE